MPDGGLLAVELSQKEHCLVLRVSDQGLGMTADQKEKLFQPFQSGFRKGSGLGMAIVYQIIRQHEGEPADYFTTLVNRASSRHTLAVRSLYSASPLFLWLFDSWFFIALTLFWGIKFIGFQDFAHVLRRQRST